MSAATKEKAAWVLVPPEAAKESSHSDVNPDQQRLTNLKAQLALAGHAVHEIESGFLVCRWGQSRVCTDMAALVNFARQVGVKA